MFIKKIIFFSFILPNFFLGNDSNENAHQYKICQLQINLWPSDGSEKSFEWQEIYCLLNNYMYEKNNGNFSMEAFLHMIYKIYEISKNSSHIWGDASSLFVLNSELLHKQKTAPHNSSPSVEELIVDQLGKSTLYAPWRNQYWQMNGSQANHNASNKNCAFCSQLAAQQDEKYLILKRFSHCFVMLNLYPYTKGHLLIVPYAHVKNLDDLSIEARREIIELCGPCVDILKKSVEAQGANIGINLEREGGASIPDHLHVQILPRRACEYAFIQTIGNTVTISWDMQKLYRELKPYFEKISL